MVDLVRETMCDTVLAELNAAPVDARSRSRGGKQVLCFVQSAVASDELREASLHANICTGSLHGVVPIV